MQLNELTIEQAHQGLANKEFTSRELTQACLDAIEKHDNDIQAFLEITSALALDQADAADEKFQEGSQDILNGIPLAIKDIILQSGVLATAGSKILENYVATYDATVISKLKESGAVLVGKTNMDEFAMGSSNENSAYKKTHNPWDLERVPGGSSGGSTAAVAANMCMAALGTDTGGSVRQPASFCGTVGLKPTYGRVSRFGIMAMTSSLDQVGPITKSVKDAALLLQAIAGQDVHDSSSSDQKDISTESLNKDIKGMKIGIPKQYFIEGMDSDIRQIVNKAIAKLRDLGADIVEVNLPLTKYALAVYQLTVTSEVSSNLARYDGIRFGHSSRDGDNLEKVYVDSRAQGFGDEVKRRIMLGTYALSAGYYDQYYVQAQKVRAMIQKEFTEVFKKVDVLVAPTSPTVAFKLEEKFADPLTMYLSDIYTVPANIGGVCAISVPCGFSEGLPVGLQIMSKPFDEETMLQVAYQYEQATEWHEKKPELY